MSSEEAYRLSQARHSDPVDVSVAEDLVGELEGHLASLSPTVRSVDARRRHIYPLTYAVKGNVLTDSLDGKKTGHTEQTFLFCGKRQAMLLKTRIFLGVSTQIMRRFSAGGRGQSV